MAGSEERRLVVEVKTAVTSITVVLTVWNRLLRITASIRVTAIVAMDLARWDHEIGIKVILDDGWAGGGRLIIYEPKDFSRMAAEGVTDTQRLNYYILPQGADSELLPITNPSMMVPGSSIRSL